MTETPKNFCKMCEEYFYPQDEEHQNDNICESCFADAFDGTDLEDKLEVLLNDRK